MIRELATKRLVSPSRTHVHTDTKLSRRTKCDNPLSNVAASLDVLKLTVEEDSEIEISGPFPLPPVARKKQHAIVQHANAKPCVFLLLVAVAQS